MCKNCKECSNLYKVFNNTDRFSYISCKLDNVCHNLSGKEANSCENYNKDLSNEHICLNCKHFLGGGDWGLSCSADYYTLVTALNGEKCDNFTKKHIE